MDKVRPFTPHTVTNRQAQTTQKAGECGLHLMEMCLWLIRVRKTGDMSNVDLLSDIFDETFELFEDPTVV